MEHYLPLRVADKPRAPIEGSHGAGGREQLGKLGASGNTEPRGLAYRLNQQQAITATYLIPLQILNRMALYAIIAGVGPGTGATIARKFAKAYPVVLLARNEDSFKPIVAEIERDGGRAFGVAADVSSRESLNAALSTAEKSLGSLDRCAVSLTCPRLGPRG